MSRTLFSDVNNIKSIITEDQKIKLHSNEVRGDILQPPHRHLTPDLSNMDAKELLDKKNNESPLIS